MCTWAISSLCELARGDITLIIKVCDAACRDEYFICARAGIAAVRWQTVCLTNSVCMREAPDMRCMLMLGRSQRRHSLGGLMTQVDWQFSANPQEFKVSLRHCQSFPQTQLPNCSALCLHVINHILCIIWPSLPLCFHTISVLKAVWYPRCTTHIASS